MAKKAKKKKKRKASPKQKKILKAFRTCYKEADIWPSESKKMTKSNKENVHACALKKLEKQGITIKPKKY